MTTTSLPRMIRLHQPAALRWLDTATENLRGVYHQLKAWHARRAEWRRCVEAERALAELSPYTLQDIGAPQGLIGQRRWQDEHEAAQLERVLNLHGW